MIDLSLKKKQSETSKELDSVGEGKATIKEELEPGKKKCEMFKEMRAKEKLHAVESEAKLERLKELLERA